MRQRFVDAARSCGLALEIFLRIDGTQRAGALAHYAFFSLFPAFILLVAVASLFIERERATAEIIAFAERYIPLGAERRDFIFDTLAGVINSRGPASLVATLFLCWAVMRFFATLIRATNRAWGMEVHTWWRLRVKSLLFLAAMVAVTPLVIAIPLLLGAAKSWLTPHADFAEWIYAAGGIVIPALLLFLALALFYKLAPRRRTLFAEVWMPALVATVSIVSASKLFGFYLKHFATLNAVYGIFGGIMALLMWIYLSGCIFVFGACLCAARDASSDRSGRRP